MKVTVGLWRNLISGRNFYGTLSEDYAQDPEFPKVKLIKEVEIEVPDYTEKFNAFGERVEVWNGREGYYLDNVYGKDGVEPVWKKIER